MLLYLIKPYLLILGLSVGLHDTPKAVIAKIPFESTITYQLLQLDQVFYGDNKREVKLCKELMQTAVKRINLKYSANAIATANAKTAASILGIIDSTFTDYRFLFIDNVGENISLDFLTPALRFEADGALSYQYYNQVNEYRRFFWEKRDGQTCRLIDCDLYSEIYVGIGQMAGLPLAVVELPGHMYLRWNYSNGGYLPWDPTAGSAYADEKAITNYQVLTNYNKDFYFFNMPLNYLKAHYYNFRAGHANTDKELYNPELSREAYEASVTLRPNNPFIYNCYVWLHIRTPGLDKSLDLKKMHGYIDAAIKLEPNLLYYDAKACLYALNKDFKNAIAMEQIGLKHNDDSYHRRKEVIDRLNSFKANKFVRPVGNSEP